MLKSSSDQEKDNPYKQYHDVLYNILLESNTQNIRSIIENVPTVYTTNDQKVLNDWESKPWAETVEWSELQNTEKKLALRMAKDITKKDQNNIQEYLDTTLKWTDSLDNFINCILLTGNIDPIRCGSSFKIPLLVFKSINFDGKLINYNATLQNLKSQLYSSYQENKNDYKNSLLVTTSMFSNTIEDLNNLKTKYIRDNIYISSEALLFATLGIISKDSENQIKILEELWGFPRSIITQSHKIDVYNKYGATIFASIMLANTDKISNLIEWFRTNKFVKTPDLNINEKLQYLYTQLFQQTGDLYDSAQGFGAYYVPENDEDEDEDDKNENIISEVIEQISTALTSLVLAGNFQNLLDSDRTLQNQVFYGAIDTIYARLYTQFNNAGNMQYLFKMDLLHTSYLHRENNTTKEYLQYLWAKLLPEGITTENNTIIKVTWILFHVAFRGINVKEMLDDLWHKLESKHEIRDKLLSKQTVNIDPTEDDIADNWLSVRLCEVAAIRNDLTILDWFWEKTETHAQKDEVRKIALTNGMWSFGYAIEKGDLNIANWIWNKVKELDDNLCINLLINKESYQPHLEWAFMKVVESSLPLDKKVQMLGDVFKKINNLYDEGKIEDKALRDTLDVFLSIGLRKAHIIQNTEIVKEFSKEMHYISKDDKLLKKAFFGNELTEVNVANSISNKVLNFLGIEEDNESFSKYYDLIKIRNSDSDEAVVGPSKRIRMMHHDEFSESPEKPRCESSFEEGIEYFMSDVSLEKEELLDILGNSS